MKAVQDSPPVPAVAIIGMACIFPKAPDLETFWANIQARVDGVGEPTDDWEPQRYLDRSRDPNDRVSTAYGGFLKDLYRFDPTEFGIMPNSLDGGEPDQFLALKVARDALADAGYLGGEHDHTRTGIILGHSTYLHRGHANIIQHGVVLDQTIELLGTLLPHLDAAALQDLRAQLKKRLPAFNADIAPGLVPNVMTGRIANRLNLQGPNYIVDAACASSLLSIRASITELLTGESDLMLAGGVNASLPPEVSVIFSQLGALSPSSRIRPFSAAADGTLLGEGLGVVVLKRLADARACGDRIYAVLRGVGSSSDGRGQSLLAPRLEGEMLAISRAYELTGIDPRSLGLIEAHGTGIPLGDRTEIAALSRTFGGRHGTVPSIGIGSVKSQIAHCIPAAGIAGLIKTSLALYHRVLPPTLCDDVSNELGLEQSPFYVNTEARPWIHPFDTPRRAAVDSFGFGGINCHAILEEPPADTARTSSEALPGGAELVILSAADRAGLIEQLDRLERYLKAHTTAALRDIAFTAWRQIRGRDDLHRLALVATDLNDLETKLAQSRKRLQDPKRDHFSTRSGSLYCSRRMAGALAFLFPGEGSQYPGMLATLAMRFPPVRQWFDLWQSLYEERSGFTPAEVLFPPPTGLDDAARLHLEQRLHDMDMGSEASFIAAQALYALFDRLGLKADVMVGHSTGENSALVASGAIAWKELREVGALMTSLNQTYEAVRLAGKIPTGTLLTVGAAPRALVESLVAQSGGQLHLAMDNCDNQLVLFGEAGPIRVAAQHLESEGALCSTLPFDRAYHTPVFAEVSAAFESYYSEIGLAPPQVTLYSCASADRFPADGRAVQALAAAQWSSRVRFTETVQKMYADGTRYFVEVGPSGNLTAFVDDILRGREYVAIQSNVRLRDDLTQLLHMLGTLFVHGRQLDLGALFDGRPLKELDWAEGAPAFTRHGIKLRNTLPVLRLSDEQVPRLRELLSPPASPLPLTLTDFAERAVPGPSQPLIDESANDQASAIDDVMHRYLDLMQNFVLGQSEVLARTLGPGTPMSPAEPFLDRVVAQGPGWLECACRLSLSSDRFLRHHVLSGPVSEFDPGLLGLAVVPLTVSLEMMAEVSHRLLGGGSLLTIEDVRAYKWLALDFGEIEVSLHAAQRDAGEPGLVHAMIMESGTPVIEANLRFGEAHPGPLEPIPSLTDNEPYRWLDEELYAHGMFHGPLFQSVAHVRRWSPKGIDAELNPPELDGFFAEGEAAGSIFNPVLLDALGQLSAYWMSQKYGTDFNSFPSRIGRIAFVEPLPDPDAGLMARGRVHPESATGRSFRFDYDCVDREKRVLIRVWDWEDVFYPVPNRYYETRWRPQDGWLGEAAAMPEIQPAGGILWWIPPLPEGLLDDSGAIFKRLLAHAVLSAEERETWFDLSDNAGRRTEWLMGRIALKEATRQWVLANTGHPLYPADVPVWTDDRGRPFVGGHWQESLTAAPEVSLSHSGGYCLAVAGPPGMSFGVDLEWPGKLREPGLVADSFSAAEQDYLQTLSPMDREQAVLALWCAKEAAAKCLGIGLGAHTGDFAVRMGSTLQASASVTFGDTEIEVKFGRHQGAVIAIASMPQLDPT
jgi:acyl transferase domain-containing protein/phosphopantetheinyl transferase